ncbi:unnamed protein product [Thelazia callipaeda]|uniref:Anion exchange protein n=1 Tax=Thelazia callipaeda TaxID=103827 RepID=A0A0N5D6C0_THECL|nr:unnamed protein product [Thelazia callipaeda]
MIMDIGQQHQQEQYQNHYLYQQPKWYIDHNGGMSCDLSRTEESELELIEKDLAVSSFAKNQHKSHSFYAAKNGSGFTSNEPISILSTSFSGSEAGNVVKKHAHNQVFVELYDLDLQKGGKWTETARWIKYEEDVEGADHHWGQPHVAFLSFHALLSLRKFIRTGMILLDCKAKTFTDVCEQVANAMILEGINCKRKDILQILSMKQAHPFSRRLTPLLIAGTIFDRRSENSISITGNMLDNSKSHKDVINREHSFQIHDRKEPTIVETDERTRDSVSNVRVPYKQQSSPNLPTSPAVHERSFTNCMKQSTSVHSECLGKFGTHSSEIYKSEDILKKLPIGIETVQIFVGIISTLTKAHFVMLRLKEPTLYTEILDGEVPVRFIIVILGPDQSDVSYHEVGRSIATLMTNMEFSSVAYKATVREELISAVDNFLDDSVVIPPGEIDSKRLLSCDEIRKAMKKRRNRKNIIEKCDPRPQKTAQKNDGSFTKHRIKEGRCRFFSGMISDFEKRFPYYWSDYLDAFNFQCLASVVFMFCASFAPAITFGGLLGKYTNEKIGIIETLMAQCICGILWGLLAVQPLMIMSATGPVLVFEVSLYAFCEYLSIDFLTLRLYSGIWVLLISAATVAVDGSRMLRYVTRFTEDIFASLISVIFIAESLRFLYQTFVNNPVANFEFYKRYRDECDTGRTRPLDSEKSINCHGEPNTALLTTIIMISTFALAYGLRQLRQSYYLGRTLRRAIGDFGVLISIAVVASIAHFCVPDPYLQRLEVPDSFNFTNVEARRHGLFVSAYLPLNQLWVILVALVAALLVFILLFVETEITELLLSRKDRGLVKGSGLHWDLLLMGLCTLLCSVFGLPWMCAAAVQSLAHCSSLSVPKKTAPGERPGVDHVIEQRVTTIGVSLLIGFFAFGGSYLRLPLASLFGVFLYLGLMNLVGVQFIQRIILFFIPKKYFPDTPYTESLDSNDESDNESGWLEKDYYEDAPLPV